MKCSVRFYFVLLCLSIKYQLGICQAKHQDQESASSTTDLATAAILLCAPWICIAYCGCCLYLCHKCGHRSHHRRPSVCMVQSGCTSHQQAARFGLQDDAIMSKVRSLRQKGEWSNMQPLGKVETVPESQETR